MIGLHVIVIWHETFSEPFETVERWAYSRDTARLIFDAVTFFILLEAVGNLDNHG